MREPRDRREREQEFHDRLFAHGGRERLAGINRLQEPARTHLGEVLRSGPDPDVILELGVGRVSRLDAPEIRRRAFGVAIDISSVGLRRAAAASGGDIGFVRADAQMLPFRTSSVDLIVGSSIVHHLDVGVTVAEMARVLDDGGRAVVLEPRRGSPLLRLFRRVTPAMRSADEHPLSAGDVAALRAPFARSQVTDFALTSLLAAPLLRFGRGGRLAAALTALDRRLLRLVPALGRWAWIVVLELASPRPARVDQRHEMIDEGGPVEVPAPVRHGVASPSGELGP